MKNKFTNQNKLTRQEKEDLSNKTVLLSSFTILYALLLLFFRKMCSYSGTVYGAVTFMDFLMWASLLGTMACAAWSAYKEKKGFFLYSGMCLFVFLSMLIILHVPSLPDNRAYMISFAALFAAFVIAQVYYALAVSGKFTQKAKAFFIVIVLLIIVVFTAASFCPAFWTFLLNLKDKVIG